MEFKVRSLYDGDAYGQEARPRGHDIQVLHHYAELELLDKFE